MVCLDYREACADGTCPLTGRAGLVMGLRLDDTSPAPVPFPTVYGTCAACRTVTRLELLDDERARCGTCETRLWWSVARVHDDERVVVTRLD